MHIYIYIYDKNNLTRGSKDKNKVENVGDFGSIDPKLREVQISNLNKRIQKGSNPVSIGTYKIFDENKIEMRWHFHETTEIVFKGEVLLDGDAIKGTFYKNGEVNVSERVYYNIDKPLPDKLIEETVEM